ncbi:MAG: hypothetical protein ACRDRA_17360 [Pseudonocardiaceae bacterium]
MNGAECSEQFSPDGLTEQAIDALLPLVWPQHQPQRRATRYEPLSGGCRASSADVQHTRPGDPNRQERAHRAGAPLSPATATKEIGMLQLHACVIIRCDQCGDRPGRHAHYPTEDAALDAAAVEEWHAGPGGRLWCSACATVLTCEAEGHEFSAWRHPLTSGGQPALSEYRHCRRCCLDDSRPARWLIGSAPRQGRSAGFSALLAGAATHKAEVA